MVSYKDTYEGRLPYPLSSYHDEHETKSSYETRYSCLKKSLRNAALYAKRLFEK